MLPIFLRYRSALVAVVAALGVLQAAGAESQPAAKRPPLALNDSGMAYCKDAAGNYSLSCKNTGQDGEFGRDISKPDQSDGNFGFSFSKVCNSGETAGTGACPANPPLGKGANDWSCTFDRVTGLIWEVKADDGSVRDKDKTFSNYNDRRPGDASAYAQRMSARRLCGIDTWRLPNLNELLGIVDHGLDHPAGTIDEQFFPNTVTTEASKQSPYWASNGSVLNWMVDFTPDPYEQFTAYPADADGQASVRLVSGIKPEIPANRYTVFGDQITDTLTGLVWDRCVQGMVYNGVDCIGTPTVFTSQQATDYSYFLYVTTGEPWRMPNIKELASLFDDSKFVFSGLGAPFSVPSGNYISATPGAFFNYGQTFSGLGSAGENGTGFARFVRISRPRS